MRTLGIMLLLAAAALQAQTLRIGGGAAPMENILKPLKGPLEAATSLRLELKADGPEVAFRDLDAGKLDAAAAGLSFEDWVKLMASKGYVVKDADAYQVSVIGADRIHVLLHPELAIVQMTLAQVKAVFTGRIGNWKELGGPDLAVVRVVGTKVPGTNKVFQEKVLGQEPMAAAGITVGATPEILATISKTPGAVGFGPRASTGDWKVWAPELDFEIGRPIVLITRGPHSEGIRKLLVFLKEQGGKYVAK